MSSNRFAQQFRHRWVGRYFSQATHTAGLTLIECLVAIVVIAASMAATTPMMVTAVATRIQNQKAEQALQLAQAEVDKVRLAVERGDTGSIDKIAEISGGTVAAAGAPTADTHAWPTGNQNTALQVDIDDDGTPDYAVQVIKTRTTGGANPLAFELGVRVYDYASFDRNKTSLETRPAQLSFTSGEGQRATKPLAVLYTTIVQPDRENSLCDYRRYLGSTPPASMNCD
ncbi:type II secretion system protein [Romeria aff. gracilis LEGE 07310]|uniref:Type II secretion system protein n=1 Tax=Vasconcelosia minhoensis LEGE 07310 TaxID=915328 RepID=A0A8J7A614_9CYAN|nr:type II secretion system protein [Romeria gracilis]MBE9076555.1 type II secretion system protein [Romeria aff. gracilis LEGE 07310]